MRTLLEIAFVAAIMAATPAAAAVEDAPLVTKSGPLGTVEAGKGMVVFFRPGSLIGGALGCTVREGEGTTEVEVARLGSGKYFAVQATPGKHQYFTKGEATDRLNLEVEEGETYFVKCKIGMGVVAGRANISPSDRAAFAQKAKGLALWKGREAVAAKGDATN